MEEAKRPATLAGRIAKISAEIGAIAKSGRNQQQGYAYIEYGRIAAELRVLQDKYGVAIFPEIEDQAVAEVRNSKGGIGYHYLLHMKFKVVNTDDQNDFIEAKWLGEATDYGDKGVNKASTCGEKYFLMKLYHISEQGDDPDQNTPEEYSNKQIGNRGQNNTRQLPPAQKQKINFELLNQVRAKLPSIGTVENLQAYWMKLNLPKREQSLLKGDFAKRKKEILGDEPEAEQPAE